MTRFTGKKNAIIIFVIGAILLSFANTYAQEKIGDMYVRKAVKEFVARQYDAAINDLEQALVADSYNAKARKLLAKCHERKAGVLFANGDFDGAKKEYQLAVISDSANGEAKAGLSRLEEPKQSVNPDRIKQIAPQPAVVVPQQQIPAFAQPQPIIVTPQMMPTDPAQAKVVEGLLQNFQKQQELMVQQLAASTDLAKRSDTEKERYLAALINASEQKSSMMREFIIIGAIVIVVVIIITLIVFILIFGKYSKASELRTIEASEVVQAILASQPALLQQNQHLQIAAPDTKNESPKPTALPVEENVKDAQTGVTVDELSVPDSSLRAKTVEMLEYELVNGGASNPNMAPKIEKLKELLKDSNNRVRANAAKAYYLVDPVAALKELKDMMSGGSSRLKASALWVLGEISSQESLDLILSKDNESDEIVCYNIRMALDKIKARNSFPQSDETRIKIEKRLTQYADAG